MAARNPRNKKRLVVAWELVDVPDAKQRILQAYELLLADLNNPQEPFDKDQQNRHDPGRRSKP